MASFADSEGAIVVWRPIELASDSASSENAVQHAIASLIESGLEPPEFALLVQCTSPFLAPTDLDAVVNLLKSGTVDSCFTAARNHRFLWSKDSSGVAIAVNHDPSQRLPRQSLDPEFVETGGAYGFVTSGFIASNSRFFGRIDLVEVAGDRALEIDDPSDLAIAQVIASSTPTAGKPTEKTPLPDIVSALVLDFDGVLTNDQVIVNEDGVEAIVANRGDGLGISLLHSNTSIQMLVMSTEVNSVVMQRCEKLKIECMSAVTAKGVALKEWLTVSGIEPSECIYVGNDVNDLAAMEIAGFSVAPADAHPSVLRRADLVLAHNGGEGAVRELADLLLQHAETARHW